MLVISAMGRGEGRERQTSREGEEGEGGKQEHGCRELYVDALLLKVSDEYSCIPA